MSNTRETDYDQYNDVIVSIHGVIRICSSTYYYVCVERARGSTEQRDTPAARSDVYTRLCGTPPKVRYDPLVSSKTVF